MRQSQPSEVAKLGREAVKANARRFAANVRPIIDDIMRGGATSHNAIAAKLNERNVRTARGGIWISCSGWRDLERLANLPARSPAGANVGFFPVRLCLPARRSSPSCASTILQDA